MPQLRGRLIGARRQQLHGRRRALQFGRARRQLLVRVVLVRVQLRALLLARAPLLDQRVAHAFQLGVHGLERVRLLALLGLQQRLDLVADGSVLLAQLGAVAFAALERGGERAALVGERAAAVLELGNAAVARVDAVLTWGRGEKGGGNKE